MRDVHELLSELASQNVKLWTEDNRLRVSAPKGVLTAALQDRLRIHKIELINLLDARDGRNQKPALQPYPRTGTHHNEAPLSYAQQRLWFVDQLEGGSNGYVLPSALRLTGTLDVARLQTALSALVARHESLRTTFDEVDGELVQRVHPPQPVELHHEYLLHLPTNAREAEARHLSDADMRRPFDLKRGPLLRCTLFKLDDDDHILFVLMHHIVADGWSVPILAGEVTHHYAQPSATLPPLDVQYADFAQWQRSWLHGTALQKQLDYWTKQLSDAPPLIELPTDRPRTAAQTFRSESINVEVTAVTVKALTALAQQHGATLYMVVLAAYGILLARYSRQTSVIIGSPIANRTDPALEPLIGFFVNTLAMRVDIDADASDAQTFVALLQQVKQMTLDAYANQDAPFEQIVDALKLPRTLNHTPLFQVMLAWLTQTGNASMDKHMSLPGTNLNIEQLEWGKTNNAFELVLSITETAHGLFGSLQYLVELFDRETAERMVAHFEQLLNTIAAHAEQSIHTLPLLTAQETQRMLADWNTPAIVPHTDEQFTCVHTLFEAQAQRTPNAIALAYEDRSLSYAELNAQADALAQQLRERGVGAGNRIAICVTRSIEMLVAVMGVMKTGAAYVPLDPAYPAERLAYMLNDAEVKGLLRQHGNSAMEQWDNMPAERLTDELTYVPADLPTHDPTHSLSPDSPVYIIYTSGSTGQPKGVVVPHRGVANTARAISQMVNLGVGDRLLQFVPFAFDASALEFFATLTSGATLVLHPNPTQLSTSELHALCVQQRVTAVNFTVALWQQWVENLTAQGTCFPEHLRVFLTGGDKPFAQTLRAWAALANHKMTFVCSYGPTEASITTTAYATTNHAVQHNPPDMIPLGAPLPNMCIYIVDTHGQLAPVGVAGELVIGGLGVADGYWQREELTRERFVNQLAGVQVANPMRFYRSGDLACWLPDGRCEFVGRVDTQVKIRGFRIELGEIEAQLKALAQVREAVVLAVAVGNDKRVVAYYQPSDSTVTRADLVAALRPVLPPHMLPSAWVAMPSFSLTPNGKLDRNALPLPDATDDTTAYVAPRNDIENKLAEIWQDVLGLKPVGVESNFFDLGGHSLLATQVVSRIRQVFKVDVPLRALFEAPTIAGLAPQVNTAAQWIERPALTRANRGEPLPLSFAQQRLWLLQQLNPDSSFFNMPIALRLNGSLNLAALQASFNALVQRHEILRTHFPLVNGVPVQLISPDAAVMMSMVDTHEDQFVALATQAAEQPFDLLTGPLLRVTLLRTSHDVHALLVTMHHIIGDNWSLEIFMREFTTLYAAHTQGAPATLPELPFQFADFAQWQRDWLQGDVLKQQLDYWEARLGDAPAVLELPTDRPRPAQQRFVGDMLTLPLDNALAQQLRQLSREHGTTLHMTLLAGFATLLARYSGVDDLVIGIPIAGRNDAQVEPMIGYFLNTLALRIRLQDNPSFASVLQQVKQVTLDAYAHQDAPFEQVIAVVNPTPQLSHSPIFQVLFDVLKDTTSALALPNLDIQPIGFVKETSKFDINLVFSDDETDLTAAWEFNTDLFDRATIARMAQHLQNLLCAAVAQPQRAVNELSLLSDNEQHALLVQNNQTQREYPLHLTVPELFEAQAQRTPDAIAVRCGDNALTYRQLSDRASLWAQGLARHGVAADVIVTPFFERGIDFLTAILATFKAGGAYLPLDPHTPTPRIRQILEQSKTPLVLTNAIFLPVVNESVTEMAHAPKVVLIDDLAHPAPEYFDIQKETEQKANASNLAYVIFTSGSTGVPKGVMVEQRGLVNHLHAMQTNLGLSAADVIGQTATQSYVISVWQFLAALITGAQVQIVSEEIMFDPAALLDEIERRNISVVQIVPSMMRLLVEALAKREQGLPACVRWMIPTGEALPPALVRTWFEHCPKIPLLNAYGSSECSDDVAHDVITAPPGEHVVNMPAGYPIPNVQMFVLDAQTQPVPIGVAGELFVGGAGVGRGYLGDEVLTAQKFVQAQICGRTMRLYKTGDRARVLPNGAVEYLGRLDFQVKVRGIRIELGEIEATLGAHPAVAQAVLLARDDAQGSKQLVAYVVLHENQSATAQDLRTFVAQQLPDYMVPSAVMMLEQMPLNASGKVARSLLPQPRQLFQADAETYVAPRNETETAIVEILSQVMGLDASTLGVQHNFFDLGGHSMQAIQVVAKMRDQFGIDLPLRSLFERTTVEGLAQLVAETQATNPTPAHEEAWSPLVPLQANPTQPPIFFIHAAGGALFWYLALLKHMGTGYNAHGIQGHGLRSEQLPLQSIPEMAKRYRDAIKQAHPNGPYHLVGYSMGGLLAYELAQQFRENGDEVGTLALLDSYVYIKKLPYPGQGIKDPDEKLMMQMLYDWDDREAKKMAKQLRTFPNYSERNHYLLQMGKQAGLIPPTYELDDMRRLYATTEAHIKAIDSYKAQPYAGAMTLFRCTDRSESFPARDWHELVQGELNIIAVPGKHSTLMDEPNVIDLAKKLQQLI